MPSALRKEPAAMPATPSATTRARLKQVRRALAQANLPALLITNRHDHVYLIGFTGEDSAVLITRKDVHLISDGRFATSIKQEAPWAKVSLRRGSLHEEIAKVVRSARVKRLGIQAEALTVADRAALGKGLRGVRLLAAPPICADLRVRKQADELALIEKATRIAEAAYRATLKTLRLGQTELEIAGRLEYEMKRRGSTEPAFGSIVALDANAALPHAVPGTRKLRKGCTLLVDWGATYRFYRSDLTRTVFIASIPPRMEAVYATVLTAQRRGDCRDPTGRQAVRCGCGGAKPHRRSRLWRILQSRSGVMVWAWTYTKHRRCAGAVKRLFGKAWS
jgi:Xaa-Pro aminopeptidase